MKLQNTLNVPNQFAAQGINHVAIYQDGVVSTYQKNKPFAKMALDGPTYSIMGVRQIRISPSGEYIAVQTKTKTVRLHNGVQENFDNNVGAFSIADTGQIVMIALASGAVQVIDSSVTNLTVAVTDDDRVVCAKGRYMVYNRARTIVSTYDNLVLSPVASAKEIVWATHDHNGKFVVFYSDGTFSYDGAAAKALAVPNLLGFRDAGDQILATDKKKDWCVNHFRPLAFPEQVRAFKWTAPPSANADFEDLLLMAPGSGIASADFDLKNGLAIANSTAVTSVADAPYGAAGKSWLFNGTTSTLQTADSANIQLGANDFTIEFFVKVDPATSPVATVVQKGGGLNVSWSSFLLQAIATTKTFAFSVSFNNTQIDVGTSDGNGWGSFEFNVWTHIAITRKGNKWRCFQDGKLRVTYTASGTVFANSGRGIQFGHSRQTNFNTGALYGQFKGNINGFQILNYAKYKHDFYPETLSIDPNSPPFPLTGTLLSDGVIDAYQGSFSAPQFGAGNNRAIIPTTDKIRVLEKDLSVTEITKPTDSTIYAPYSMVDDSFIGVAAVGSKGFLSINGGSSFAEIAPANTYNTGLIFKFKGYIWMLYAGSVRRYNLTMTSFSTLTRSDGIGLMQYDYWDCNANCIISTTNQSANGANLYISWTGPESFGAYALGLSTNMRISYVGNNVFYIRSVGTTGISKLVWVPATAGAPALLADLPKIYDSIALLGRAIVLVDSGTIYSTDFGSIENAASTKPQAQTFANAIQATVGQNPKPCITASAKWCVPWKAQKRMVIGTNTGYQVWQF